MTRINKKLSGKQLRIVGQVHDSILFEVKKGWEKQYIPAIRSIMEDTAALQEIFGVRLTVPIVVDIKIGEKWGQGAEWSTASRT